MLGIRPAGKLTRAERAEVEAEAQLVIELVAAGAERRDVRFEAPV